MDQHVFSDIANMKVKICVHMRIHEGRKPCTIVSVQVTFTRGDTPNGKTAMNWFHEDAKRHIIICTQHVEIMF